MSNSKWTLFTFLLVYVLCKGSVEWFSYFHTLWRRKYCMKTVLLQRKQFSYQQHIVRKIKPRETMQGIYGSNFNNSHDTYLTRILHYNLQSACCKLQYMGHKTKRRYTECLTSTYTHLNKEYIFTYSWLNPNASQSSATCTYQMACGADNHHTSLLNQ